MRNVKTLLKTVVASLALAGPSAVAREPSHTQAAPPVAPPTAPEVTPPAAPPAKDAAKAPAKDAAKAPAKKAPPAKKKADAAKAPAAAAEPAADSKKAAPVVDERGPEIQKLLKLAANPKFKDFTRLAAERQTLYKQSSALRVTMRTTAPTDATLAELAAIQADIAKVAERMDVLGAGTSWTQEDYITMDFIVSEQMRIYPLD